MSRLRPLDWETVQAQSEWLLEEFDRRFEKWKNNLLCAPKDYIRPMIQEVYCSVADTPDCEIAWDCPYSVTYPENLQERLQAHKPRQEPNRLPNSFVMVVPNFDLRSLHQAAYGGPNEIAIPNWQQVDVHIYFECGYYDLIRFKCEYEGQLYSWTCTELTATRLTNAELIHRATRELLAAIERYKNQNRINT